VKARITVKEAQPENSEARIARWIDVRSASEFAAGHIPGAVNIPLDELEARLGDILAEKPVLLICQSGKRAAMAAELLENRRGEITLLEGGTKAWSAAGLPLVRSVKTRWSLERQVRVTAGLLVVIGIALAAMVHPAFVWLAAFVGLGLTFAGATDICAMGMLLAKMPWNRTVSCPLMKRNEQDATS
jgi:rhodanese-related sulfurtransferase